MKTQENIWVLIITKIVVLIVIGACWIIAFSTIRKPNLTTTESTLLGFILTIFSILTGWIITHYYAKQEQDNAVKETQEHNRETLKTYALKAAEKVNNLSSELSKLAGFLENILDTEYEKLEEELHAKEERIVSAIHIVKTLKSINDTSLSDWKGVIGEEIHQQQEQEKKETEEFLQTIMENIEELRSSMDSYKQDTSGNRNDYLSLTKELYTLQNQLRMASIRLGDSNPIPHRLVRKNLSTSNAICSSCGAQFEYIQKNKFGTIKEINCKLCGTRFLSRCVSENNFQIEPLRDVEESSVCPSCNAPISLKLSNKPGSLVDLMCANCSLPLSASRAKEGFKIRVKNSLSIVSSQPPEAGPVSQMPSPHPPEISPEIIQAVKEAMPPQPWPVDAHKEVASRLKLDAYTVRRAINQLIKCGDFKLQLDGELFDLSPSK